MLENIRYYLCGYGFYVRLLQSFRKQRKKIIFKLIFCFLLTEGSITQAFKRCECTYVEKKQKKLSCLQCCGSGSFVFNPPRSASVIICTDLDPDPLIIMQKLEIVRKSFISTVF
jgi:hypothetical protein